MDEVTRRALSAQGWCDISDRIYKQMKEIGDSNGFKSTELNFSNSKASDKQIELDIHIIYTY